MKSIQFLFQSGAILFGGSLITLAAACARLHFLPSGWTLLGLVGVPSIAILLFLMSGILLPSLAGSCRYGFPINLTYPLLHVTLMVVALMIASTEPVGLLKVPAPFIPALLWGEPRILIGCALADGILLTLPAMARPRPGKR